MRERMRVNWDEPGRDEERRERESVGGLRQLRQKERMG